ncbi:MAG: M15 family metallopeptidase [Cyanobacteria bacterium J06600_6]
MEEIEIPEAIRENPELPQKSGFPLPLLAGGVVLLGIVGFVLVSLLSPGKKPTPRVVEQPPAKPVAPKENKLSPPEDLTVAQPKPEAKTKVDLLGHLPYDVAAENELVAVTADGRLKMQAAAAEKLKQMQAAAKADGIDLAIISAFRDLETQDQLFFGIKEQRVQDAAKRAEVSAPPGYSEHHTGYAVDIGDSNAPATHLETSFADTAAFRWLEQNALKYSFELSFPVDNEYGVSYEPWHWRFVGDRDSLETFYKVRN